MSKESGDVTSLLRDLQIGRFDSLNGFLQNNNHWSTLKYKTGDTILHVAARLGLADVVIHLLKDDNCKYVDCRNRDGKTPLHEAAQFSQLQTLQTLLLQGADVNALKRADWTPLMLACTKSTSDSYKCVELLIQKGALIDYQNKDGWTALHLACREGDFSIFNLLLSHGIEVCRLTNNRRSALHIAALHGHAIIVKNLIDLGLNPNLVDSCGNTPVHEGVIGGHLDICAILFNNKLSNFRIKNRADMGVLHLAASVGCLPIIEFLVKTVKVDVNVTNDSDLTPLHCAARKKDQNTLNLLTRLGANALLKDCFGRTAVDYLSIG